MKDRIKELITYENISYSKFADIIGIQRSGVSHLINGRNNPSLEVIQKILESFDYINSEWLILGKGSMKKFEKHGDLFSQTSDNVINNDIIDSDVEALNAESANSFDTHTENEKIIDSPSIKSIKKIDRIVIFYSDKSFLEYKESK